MGNIDRRILYLIGFLVMGLPLLLPFPLPIAKNINSLNVYNAIEGVDQSKGGHLILLCVNFGPDTRGESLPMARALVRHLLRSGKKFAIWTFNGNSAPGQEMTNNAAMEIAAELTAKGMPRSYGTDWINLGFRPASTPILAGISKDIPGFFKKDQTGKPLTSFALMQGVKNATDLGLVIDVSPSATYLMLIPGMTSKYNIPLVLAPTSVMVPDTYPFLKSHQAVGELRGVLGAAEYEDLLQHRETGTKEMTSVAALDGFIIVLIVLGNIAYFRSRRTGGVRA